MDEEKREEQAEMGKLHKSKDEECCQAPRIPQKDGFVMRNMSDFLTPAKFNMAYHRSVWWHRRVFFILQLI